MADKTAYDIDLWGTSSEMFSTENAFTLKLIKTKRFALYELKKVFTRNSTTSSTSTNVTINLEPGDLIYRKNHVEFYIGNNKVIGWGKIHNTYTSYKSLNKKADGYYYNTNDLHEKNIPYTSLIKFRRLTNNDQK